MHDCSDRIDDRDFRVEEERTRRVSSPKGGSYTERYWHTVIHDAQCVRLAIEDNAGFSGKVDLTQGAVKAPEAASTALAGGAV